MAELDVAGYQATLQALSEAQARLELTVPASQAMHEYAASAIARNANWRPAHEALLRLHVDQTPGAVMPDNTQPPDDWPPTCYGPYVALRTLVRWLAYLGDPAAVKLRRQVSIDDIARKASETIAHADRLDADQSGVSS